MAISTPPVTLGTTGAPASAIALRPITPAQMAWRRFKRNRAGVLGLIIVTGMVLFALVGPLVLPYPSTSVLDASMLPMEDALHLLGTDIAGRDMLGLLAYGARTSLVVAVSVQVFVLIIGVTLGFASAWFGGRVDFIVSRVLEVIGSLPGLLFQILLVILLSQTIKNSVLVVILAIGLLACPTSWGR
jgi:ABC-type dipeptide/oligopeptide/nickel transport system permease subunit